jgi:hypothetical protein
VQKKYGLRLLIDLSENSQANIYKALRSFLADSVSTKKSGFDIVTDSLEQKNTESTTVQSDRPLLEVMQLSRLAQINLTM